MVEANRKSPPCFFNTLRKVCVAFACPFLYGAFFGCHPTLEAAVERGTVSRSPLPIEADPYLAEKLGREALAKLGYLPIINLARQAGWVTTKERRSTPRIDRALISMDGVEVAAAREFVDVFSKYAVAAGVASQADSPLPGPGDAVAVGILIIGLVNAGFVAVALFDALGDVSTPVTSSTTSSPPPITKPDKDPQPESDPRTTGPSPPISRPPPEEEKETCGEKEPKLIRCDDPKIKYRFPSEGAAFNEIVTKLRKGVRKAKREKARLGPCVNLGGFHVNVLRGGDSAATIVGCDCCDDASGKALQKQRADVIYKQ